MTGKITCKGTILLGNGCGVCDKCKEEIDYLIDKVSKADDQKEPVNTGIPGWLCPRCGSGNAPFTARCCCVPVPIPVVTC